MICAVVGANWGDEGKGKITDVLAQRCDVVVRFQGGANAGHTIINDYGRFALHMLPSGVFHAHTVNVIGPGAALDMEKLLLEYDGLISRGVPAPQLFISDRAQVVLPYHVLLDNCEEERLGKAGYGSTRSGIAPFYGDKFLKLGVQVCQLFAEDLLRQRLQIAVEQKNVVLKHLYHHQEVLVDDVIAQLQALAGRIRPMVRDTTAYLHEAAQSGKRILLEGQLGSLRDPDHGIYPYTTSSSTLAGYAPVGAGVPVTAIRQVVCVTKAYSTCVGAGPFVTELQGDEACELRSRGGDAGEYGATTGRPRRVGWFDAVATRYGCRVQGATECALTNLDVLGYLDEIPVCTGYEAEGKRITDFPSVPVLMKCRPVYTVLPGWKRDVRGAARWEDLPENCRKYVDFLQQQLEVPIRMISTGPQRSAMLLR